MSAQLVDFLDGLGEEARRNHIRESLAQIVAGVMQMEKFDSAYSQPLYEIGMDSIMGLEIATGIERTPGLRISAVELVQRALDRPAGTDVAEPDRELR